MAMGLSANRNRRSTVASRIHDVRAESLLRAGQSFDSPAQFSQLALARSKPVGIPNINEPLLLEQTIEFLEQLHNFEVVFVG